jgi:hypothetical protein
MKWSRLSLQLPHACIENDHLREDDEVRTGKLTRRAACLPQLSLETTLSFMPCPDKFRENAMLAGFAKASTRDQNLGLQLDAFQAVGCERVYTEKAFGAQRGRPELKAAPRAVCFQSCL